MRDRELDKISKWEKEIERECDCVSVSVCERKTEKEEGERVKVRVKVRLRLRESQRDRDREKVREVLKRCTLNEWVWKNIKQVAIQAYQIELIVGISKTKNATTSNPGNFLKHWHETSQMKGNFR